MSVIFVLSKKLLEEEEKPVYLFARPSENMKSRLKE